MQQCDRVSQLAANKIVCMCEVKQATDIRRCGFNLAESQLFGVKVSVSISYLQSKQRCESDEWSHTEGV